MSNRGGNKGSEIKEEKKGNDRSLNDTLDESNGIQPGHRAQVQFNTNP